MRFESARKVPGKCVPESEFAAPEFGRAVKFSRVIRESGEVRISEERRGWRILRLRFTFNSEIKERRASRNT